MQKNKRKNTNKGRGYLAGPLIGLLAMVLMLAIYALLIKKNTEYAKHMSILLVAINFLGSVICGISASAFIGNNKMINGIISGGILAAVVIILHAAMNTNGINVGSIGEKMLISLVGSAIGARVYLCKSDKRLRKCNRKRV